MKRYSKNTNYVMDTLRMRDRKNSLDSEIGSELSEQSSFYTVYDADDVELVYSKPSDLGVGVKKPRLPCDSFPKNMLRIGKKTKSPKPEKQILDAMRSVKKTKLGGDDVHPNKNHLKPPKSPYSKQRAMEINPVYPIRQKKNAIPPKPAEYCVPRKPKVPTQKNANMRVATKPKKMKAVSRERVQEKGCVGSADVDVDDLNIITPEQSLYTELDEFSDFVPKSNSVYSDFGLDEFFDVVPPKSHSVYSEFSELEEFSEFSVHRVSLCDEFAGANSNANEHTLEQYPGISSIGRTILYLIQKEKSAKMIKNVYYYLRSTRLFEAFRNNVKMLNLLGDKYYHIPHEVWFQITGISVELWKHETHGMRHLTIHGEKYEPHVYVLKPDPDMCSIL